MGADAPLVVLGVTGSIGRQTLDVATRLGREIAGIAAGRISPALIEAAEDWPQAKVAVAEEREVAHTSDVPAEVRRRLAFGHEAVAEMAATPATTVINGVVGAIGLRYTLSALEAGNRVGLANKESMVAAGALVRRTWRDNHAELIPIDSEHSALHQCLAGEPPSSVARLILTASGGPFRGSDRADLVAVTPEQALDHPTWNMGGRITVDSATLVNKGLEVIEAHHLFDVPAEAIEVVVHPQSIVHSAVQFVDGALKAHVGHPDMRVPIQYAITFPERQNNPGDPFMLAGLTLTFEEPDRDTFPALDLAFASLEAGLSAPATFNAADEVAVEAFLAGRIGFLDIVTVIEQALALVEPTAVDSYDAIVAVDGESRRVAAEVTGAIAKASDRVG